MRRMASVYGNRVYVVGIVSNEKHDDNIETSDKYAIRNL